VFIFGFPLKISFGKEECMHSMTLGQKSKFECNLLWNGGTQIKA